MVFGRLLVSVFALTATASAYAITPQNIDELLSKTLFEETLDATSTVLGDATDYQIGSEWGKIPVTKEILRNKNGAFVRAALATARLGGGTSFYIGKINGHHMMATNHHVLPREQDCASRTANFPILGLKLPCQKFYGHWPAIDLALFSIKVDTAEQEELLSRVGRNFNFEAHFYPGQELVTIGFGVFNNPQRTLVANDDHDCKVFSDHNDFRYIADPDRINPADYKAWSFSTGCDVSHGDSGSAMVDRNTGEVLGIIWTTATQKEERIRSSAYLDKLLKEQGSDVWDWLSYGVPAPKMRDYLREFLSRVRIPDEDTYKTLVTFLSKPGVPPARR